jgi:hypothetical protein
MKKILALASVKNIKNILEKYWKRCIISSNSEKRIHRNGGFSENWTLYVKYAP